MSQKVIASGPCNKCLQNCIFKVAAEKKDGSEDQFGYPCDGCKTVLCRRCEKWGTTEVRFIQTVSRKIPFFCKDCAKEREGATMKQLQRLTTENNNLKLELEKMETVLSGQRIENNDLIEENQNLTREGRNMEDCIKRMKRTTIDFEDEVFASEEYHAKKLETQKTEIYNISRENTELRKEISDLVNSVEEYKEKIKKLEADLETLISTKDDMLSTIKTLTEDNQAYMNDYKRSQQELFELKNGLFHKPEVSNKTMQSDLTYAEGNSTQNEVRSSNTSVAKQQRQQGNNQQGQQERQHRRTSNSNNNNKQHNILIIGDSSIVDLYKALKKYESLEKYKIITFVKHNARLENITEDVCELTKDFDQMDYAIIGGGLQNAIMGGEIHASVFDRLSQISNLTNLIVLSVPLWGNRSVLNRFIDQINIGFYNFVRKLGSNHTFVNVSSFLNSSFFTYRSNTAKFMAKIKIGEKLSNIMAKHFLD